MDQLYLSFLFLLRYSQPFFALYLKQSERNPTSFHILQPELVAQNQCILGTRLITFQWKQLPYSGRSGKEREQINNNYNFFTAAQIRKLKIISSIQLTGKSRRSNHTCQLYPWSRTCSKLMASVSLHKNSDDLENSIHLSFRFLNFL